MVLLRRSRRFDFYIYTAAPQHTLSYTFSKNQILNFLGPFSGPQGLLSTIFEFPYSRYITSNFFPTFLPHFFMALLRRSRRFDLILHLYGGTSQHTRFPIPFPKIKFSKFFGPFLGAQGRLPTIFEFPYSRYITSNFFRRLYPILTNFPTSSRLSLFLPGTPGLY